MDDVFLFYFYHSVDEDGEPTSVQWIAMALSSFFNGSPEDFEKWLAAMKEFYKIFYELSIQLKSAAGEWESLCWLCVRLIGRLEVTDFLS